MAADGRIARLGALIVAPRALARRDLEAQDGKAGDDLLLLAIVALILDGALAVVRAAQALAAGRTSSALHRFAEAMQPAVPLLGAWIVASLAILVFTLREEKRASVELGARVTSALVVASVLVAPFVGIVESPPLRYALSSLPWAWAAVVFGLVLREAIDAGGERSWRHAFGAGAIVILLGAASGLFLFDRALVTVAHERPPEHVGALAPPIDLPLLDGGRFQLATLRGRPVVLSFWATWCGPCMEELPKLEQLSHGRPADAPVIYAVNVDDEGPDRARLVHAVVDRFHLSMPIALDDGAASRAYSVENIPTVLRISPDGKLDHIAGAFEDLRDVLR